MSSVGDQAAGEPQVEPGMIRCEHCGRVTMYAERGWRGVFASGLDDSRVVVTICPDCWPEIERELEADA